MMMMIITITTTMMQKNVWNVTDPAYSTAAMFPRCLSLPPPPQLHQCSSSKIPQKPLKNPSKPVTMFTVGQAARSQLVTTSLRRGPATTTATQSARAGQKCARALMVSPSWLVHCALLWFGLVWFGLAKNAHAPRSPPPANSTLRPPLVWFLLIRRRIHKRWSTRGFLSKRAS